MATSDTGRAHELGSDDDVADFVFTWLGPAGAEKWWPRIPNNHWPIYLRVVPTAFVVGGLYAWLAADNVLLALAIFAGVLGAVLAATAFFLDHVTPLKPVEYHRDVFRRELRAPRPPADSDLGRTRWYRTRTGPDLITDPTRETP